VAETFTIAEAIEILEITDMTGLTEEKLSKIRRKAKRRWHPDTIAYLHPSEETIKKYERNFRLVDSAVEFISTYVNGIDYKDTQLSTRLEAAQENIKDTASYMHDTLRSVWFKVKEKGYKRREENIDLGNTKTLKDLLMQDLADCIPEICTISFVNGFVIWGVVLFFSAILVIITGNITGDSEGKPNPIILAIFVFPAFFVFLFHTILCIIGLLPLSRFWVPQFINNWVWFFIAKSISLSSFISYIPIMNLYPPLAYIAAVIIKYILIKPLYLLVALLFDKQKTGSTKKETYYAGFSEWYIEQLLTKNINQLTSDELMHVAHLYKELKDA
jgi:hypothetical protein